MIGFKSTLMRWIIWHFSRRYPFVIKGYTLWYCYYCAGWGNDPRDTDACPLCYGEGYVSKEL